MTPSKSSLGRLPKVLAERWESNREAFEAALRDGLVISGGSRLARGVAGRRARADRRRERREQRDRRASEGSGRGMGEQGARRVPRFLDDRRLRMDNNASERALRPLAVGRTASLIATGKQAAALPVP